jgi:hypothetical protein
MSSLQKTQWISAEDRRCAGVVFLEYIPLAILAPNSAVLHGCAHSISVFRLIELGQPGLHPLFVKQVVTVAMDRRDREREMASNLLSELHPRVITDDQVGQ